MAKKAVKRAAVKKAVKRSAVKKAVKRSAAKKAVKRSAAKKAVKRSAAKKAVKRSAAKKAVKRSRRQEGSEARRGQEGSEAQCGQEGCAQGACQEGPSVISSQIRRGSSRPTAYLRVTPRLNRYGFDDRLDPASGLSAYGINSLAQQSAYQLASTRRRVAAGKSHVQLQFLVVPYSSAVWTPLECGLQAAVTSACAHPGEARLHSKK